MKKLILGLALAAASFAASAATMTFTWGPGDLHGGPGAESKAATTTLTYTPRADGLFQNIFTDFTITVEGQTFNLGTSNLVGQQERAVSYDNQNVNINGLVRWQVDFGINPNLLQTAKLLVTTTTSEYGGNQFNAIPAPATLGLLAGVSALFGLRSLRRKV